MPQNIPKYIGQKGATVPITVLLNGQISSLSITSLTNLGLDLELLGLILLTMYWGVVQGLVWGIVQGVPPGVKDPIWL